MIPAAAGKELPLLMLEFSAALFRRITGTRGSIFTPFTLELIVIFFLLRLRLRPCILHHLRCVSLHQHSDAQAMVIGYVSSGKARDRRV